MAEDFPKCDLLIVIGTSLAVNPFASLIEMPCLKCPRLLLNREEVAVHPQPKRRLLQALGKHPGFDFDEEAQWRDVVHLGDCDAGVRALAAALRWGADLEAVIADGKAAFETLCGAGAANVHAAGGRTDVNPLATGIARLGLNRSSPHGR